MASAKELNKGLSALDARLSLAIQELRKIHEEIETLGETQRESFDNMPEGLQSSEKGQASERRADEIEELASNLDGFIDDLEGLAMEVY